jgi:hypothetical protein
MCNHQDLLRDVSEALEIFVKVPAEVWERRAPFSLMEFAPNGFGEQVMTNEHLIGAKDFIRLKSLYKKIQDALKGSEHGRSQKG